MVRRIIAACALALVVPLLSVGAGRGLSAAEDAGEAPSAPVRDTLPADPPGFTYTPLPEPAAQPAVRKRFGHRFVNYFARANQDRTFVKKIDFTFAGGPGYSKNTSLSLGVLAAGLYRIDRTDSLTPPSDISIFGNVSIIGCYALGVRGNNLFSHNRHKINYTLMFSSQPRDMWGVGYAAGRDNRPSNYTEKQYKVHVNYMYQVLPHTYVGAKLNFEHTAGRKFDTESAAYRSMLDRMPGLHHRYTATGLGVLVEYDSRDFIPNPYRGVYLSLHETWFPRALGDCGKGLLRTTVTVDGYQQVWNGGILAADLYGEFNSSGTPWPMLARPGGMWRLRGYYQGRYVDNNMITFQVELRQRIWRRIGCTVWGGAGNVFPRFDRFDWGQTLPNYGIGFRWELKKRVNVRLDYGFGRKTGGFLMNLNEAF